MQHNGKLYQVSVGRYPSGAPAEVFVNGVKTGSDLDAVTRDACVLLSIACQYGVPVKVLRGAITRGWENEPMSIIGVLLDRLAEEETC